MGIFESKPKISNEENPLSKHPFTQKDVVVEVVNPAIPMPKLCHLCKYDFVQRKKNRYCNTCFSMIYVYRNTKDFVKEGQNLQNLEKVCKRGAVAIVFVIDNKWTIIQQRSGTVKYQPWSLTIPGGHFEKEETVWESVVRETGEEMGFDISSYRDHVFAVYEYIKNMNGKEKFYQTIYLRLTRDELFSLPPFEGEMTEDEVQPLIRSLNFKQVSRGHYLMPFNQVLKNSTLLEFGRPGYMSRESVLSLIRTGLVKE